MAEKSPTIRRIVAALAVVAAVGHLGAAAAAGFGPGTLPMTATITVMAVLCLPCAVQLWRTASDRSWIQVGGSAALMVVLHVVLMQFLDTPLAAGTDGGSAAVHHHLHDAEPSRGHTGLILLTMLEVAVAIACAAVLLGRRASIDTVTKTTQPVLPTDRSARSSR